MNYHSEYMLFRDAASDPSVNFHRYTDHRQPDDQNRMDRQRKNVTDCVHSLRPDQYEHQETYRRIMARGRQVQQEMGNVADDQENRGASGNPSPR